MLAWNQRKVRQLTPGEIWLFIIGRVLLAFALGALAMRYYPAATGALALPAAAAGVACLLLAAKGLARRGPDAGDRPRPAV